jgi:hypothetical protein
VLAAGKEDGPVGFVWGRANTKLMMKERRPAIRTLRGWAISVLLETGAIRECEEHGWMQDRADPHTRERALTIAREDPPAGVSPEECTRAWVDGEMLKASRSWRRVGLPPAIF